MLFHGESKGRQNCSLIGQRLGLTMNKSFTGGLVLFSFVITRFHRCSVLGRRPFPLIPPPCKLNQTASKNRDLLIWPWCRNFQIQCRDAHRTAPEFHFRDLPMPCCLRSHFVVETFAKVALQANSVWVCQHRIKVANDISCSCVFQRN